MSFFKIQWSRNSQGAAAQAVQLFQLHRGWQAFNKDDWVVYVTQKYPALAQIALDCSTSRPLDLHIQVQLVLGIAANAFEDAPLVVAYFACKLGLEELSCRANGSAARACDKRAAFTTIVDALLALSN